MGDLAWWAWLVLAAALAAAGGFALGRMGGRRVTPAGPSRAAALPVLRALAQGGVAMDVMPRDWVDAGQDAPYEPLARCVARQAGPDGLDCEVFAGSGAAPGTPVTCFFAPMRVGGRAVNAFETVIASQDFAAEPPLLTLAPPMDALSQPRRKHPRKRVSDQRFVRVRLWLARFDQSSLHFPDAQPDIRINAYEGGSVAEGSVTDISAGGLALEVPVDQAPPGLALGAAVVLKCSLFLFKQKQFKPYWYAGVVRGLGQAQGPGGTVTRIAIGFTHVGAADSSLPQGVAFTPRNGDDGTGGSA